MNPTNTTPHNSPAKRAYQIGKEWLFNNPRAKLSQQISRLKDFIWQNNSAAPTPAELNKVLGEFHIEGQLSAEANREKLNKKTPETLHVKRNPKDKKNIDKFGSIESLEFTYFPQENHKIRFGISFHESAQGKLALKSAELTDTLAKLQKMEKQGLVDYWRDPATNRLKVKISLRSLKEEFIQQQNTQPFLAKMNTKLQALIANTEEFKQLYTENDPSKPGSTKPTADAESQKNLMLQELLKGNSLDNSIHHLLAQSLAEQINQRISQTAKAISTNSGTNFDKIFSEQLKKFNGHHQPEQSNSHQTNNPTSKSPLYALAWQSISAEQINQYKQSLTQEITLSLQKDPPSKPLDTKCLEQIQAAKLKKCQELYQIRNSKIQTTPNTPTTTSNPIPINPLNITSSIDTPKTPSDHNTNISNTINTSPPITPQINPTSGGKGR